MLWRKLIRIELRGEDLEEYEKMKKFWSKDLKKDEEVVKVQSFLGINDDLLMLFNDFKRILKIYERIGYKLDIVLSDGIVMFLFQRLRDFYEFVVFWMLIFVEGII